MKLTSALISESPDFKVEFSFSKIFTLVWSSFTLLYIQNRKIAVGVPRTPPIVVYICVKSTPSSIIQTSLLLHQFESRLPVSVHPDSPAYGDEVRGD